MNVRFLGHASLDVEVAGRRVFIDPWFAPDGAFLGSWFPFPDNSHLVSPDLFSPDVIVISHEHLDHVDPWYLARVPPEVPVYVPEYPTPVLRQKILAGGPRKIFEVQDWDDVEVTPGLFVRFVREKSPMNHDAWIVLHTEDKVLVNANDARLCPLQIRSIRASFDRPIDLFACQGAGASWYPICYDYSDEVMQKLSTAKRKTKLEYFRDTARLVDARWTLPFAGPPCFLDEELQPFNAEMDEGIFPDHDQVAGYLRSKKVSNVLVMRPGDELNLGADEVSRDAYWDDQGLSNRDEYVAKYAARRAEPLAELYRRYPVPEGSLWEEFKEYFERLIGLSSYFNECIDMRVAFRIEGPGGGDWSVNFRKGEEAVLDTAEDCQYEYTLRSRWLAGILRDDLPWEDFMLSLRFRATRNPNTYNDHLLGLLKFANAAALEQVQQFESSIDSEEQIEVRAGGNVYSIQRLCPHAGIDLEAAGQIVDGTHIVCGAHHYKFDLNTGECVTGKCPPLKTRLLRAVSEATTD